MPESKKKKHQAIGSSPKTSIIKKITLSCVISFIFLVLTFGIPIVINESYKSNSGYLTLWKASDVLSFYAVILSGIITILSLIVTIYFSKKDTEKQIRHAQSQTNVPFFIIESVCSNIDNCICEQTNSDYLWKKEFYISQLDNYRKPIFITLKNIGDGIAIAPTLESDLFDFENIVTKYVEKSSELQLKYDLKEVLQKQFGSSMLPKLSSSFDLKITLSYKNTLGIDFAQYVVFHHDIKVESNAVLLIVKDISYQTIEL